MPITRTSFERKEAGFLRVACHNAASAEVMRRTLQVCVTASSEGASLHPREALVRNGVALHEPTATKYSIFRAAPISSS